MKIANCAEKNFLPNENPRCYGKITEEEAEMMGLDTY